MFISFSFHSNIVVDIKMDYSRLNVLNLCYHWDELKVERDHLKRKNLTSNTIEMKRLSSTIRQMFAVKRELIRKKMIEMPRSDE